MPTYPQTILLQMDADVRLAAAAGGVARYFADNAGLGNEAILNLQESVMLACKHCFHCHTSATSCEITLLRYEDRLEIDLAVPGKERPQENQELTLPGVDEVHREFMEDSARLRLIKFLGNGSHTS
ncbi:MAG TPA: hypothetical protein VGF61_12050 [Candidatus Acidoferrum sp.]